MTMTQETEQQEEKKQGVVEYLQAPRKKRKNYVIIAVGAGFDKEITSSLEIYIRKNFSHLAIAMPKNENELKRLYSREIVLLIIDDNFKELEETLDLVGNFKQKKAEAISPVIFLTDRAENLIASYHKKLIVHQEVDNYVPYRNMPLTRIFARVQSALNIKDARRSRRFSINIPVNYLYLAENKIYNGNLVDISLHGGILQSTKDKLFKLQDQFKLHLPSNGILPPTSGDFLRLSAKVRRLFLSGDKVGISWEYLSETQHLLLTKYVTEIVNRDMYLKARRSGSGI